MVADSGNSVEPRGTAHRDASSTPRTATGVVRYVSTGNCQSIGPLLVCPPLSTDVSQTGATHFSKVDRAKSSSIQNVSVLRKVARRQISKFRRDQGPMANRSLFDENELGEADDRGNDSPLGPEGETLARLDRQ